LGESGVASGFEHAARLSGFSTTLSLENLIDQGTILIA
jgi:hypothetical protein